MPTTYDVEIGYAYHEGNTRLWDIAKTTINLDEEVCPFDESEISLEDYLLEHAQDHLYDQIKVSVVGAWLYSYMENELSQKSECPQCHEYEDETQIKDHGICRDCIEANREDDAYEGTEGQDRKFYTDTQDRENYVPNWRDGDMED